MKLSLVIATFNRSKQYDRAVASLKPQLSQAVELVTIEGVAGLSKARNQGWRKAKGEYVAYIDDDAISTNNWVNTILAFVKSHPDVVAFGGPYTSSNQETIPRWIPQQLTTMKIKTTKARPIKLPHEWLTGTNMIFRKTILQEMGGFDESLGVTPTRRSYGEETDLLIRIHNAGYKIWYDPKIKVQHEFARAKQSLSFLLHDQFTHGYNSRYTFQHLVKSDPVGTAGTALTRFTQPGLHLLTRIYFALSPFAYLLGMIVGKARK